MEQSFCSRISGIVLYTSIDFKSGCYIPVDQPTQWHEIELFGFTPEKFASDLFGSACRLQRMPWFK